MRANTSLGSTYPAGYSSLTGGTTSADIFGYLLRKVQAGVEPPAGADL